MAAADSSTLDHPRAETSQARGAGAPNIGREGTCAKCGAVPDGGVDALIQICDEQRQHTRAPSCSLKICAPCLRDYLQIMLRKIA